YRQLSSFMNHSLASQRLSSGFDISIVLAAITRIRGEQAGEMSAMTSHGSVVAFLTIYFLLVPGTLFTYVTGQSAKLSTLIYQGLLHFWRFVRITLLTLVAALLILGPVVAAERRWDDFVSDRFVGRGALLSTLAGMLVVLLIASLLRLYFDLVEIYTVQLGTQLRIAGRPDRRVRRSIRPAFRLLRSSLGRSWSIFLLLAIAGAGVAFITSRIAMHMLAHSHAWPMFLVAQLGLMAMLFMRFWQRGVETSLVLQHPINVDDDRYPEPVGSYRRFTPLTTDVPPPPAVGGQGHPNSWDAGTEPQDGPLITDSQTVPDPIPNPEPPTPSLEGPDPGVFHHDPVPPCERRDEDL
ncbi:MAG TPA: hypothetical protein VFS41_04740, partial [Edaphobacter sp.]|nr:hypothetical protein [Edaphobacter sp.]